MSKKHTKVAIAYDFDGTLAKGNIQENSFIPELAMANKTFWRKVKNISKKNDMDETLAYMYFLIHEAYNKGVRVTKSDIKAHGKNVDYFEGVEGFFKQINTYAKNRNVNIEHYIISSGLKEMIEGTSIARQFKYIFASSFKYDPNDVAEWPSLAINYTTKTQCLFRINKGIKNSWDNSTINKYISEEDRDIPFNSMIYIGDGETDVPAMRIVNDKGGTSIAVYTPRTQGGKSTANQLLNDKRVTYVARADYSTGEDIDTIVKRVIDQISTREDIKKYSKPR